MKIQSCVVYVALAVVCLVLAWQQRSIARLHTALEEARARPEVIRPSSGASAVPPLRTETIPPRRDVVLPLEEDMARYFKPDDELTDRVTTLEHSVAALHRGAEHLMDQGAIPPSSAKTAAWRAQVTNAGLPSQDRLAALRLLSRNRLVDDQVAQAAAAWLAATTDPNEQREILEQMRGSANPALRQVTLDLASSAEDGRVRDRAVRNLGNYGNDPLVADALWQMLASEASSGVRRRIVDALDDMPMDASRAARLEGEALSPGTPMAKKVAALRLLQSSERDVADIALTLAQDAEFAADNQSRLQYIEAFDDVNHPEFIVPLVTAVQDEDPSIRRRAADALVDYRGDENIKDWLVYLAENDPSPEVRREAARVYREDRRWGRRGGQ